MQQPLNIATFHILLALAVSERHGYDIMKQVRQDSDGGVKLGPGTLYSTIKKLLEQGWLEESAERPDPELDDSRRRYYRMTDKGREALGLELGRMDHLVRLARRDGISSLIRPATL